MISKQKDFAVIIYGAGPREQGNRSKSLRNLTTFDPSLLFVLGSVYGTGKLPLSGEFRRRENLCNPADNLTSHTYAGFAGNLTPPATASRRFRRTPPAPAPLAEMGGVGRVDDGRGKILRLVYLLREILVVVEVAFSRLRIIPYVLGPITGAKNKKYRQIKRENRYLL